MWIPWKHCGKMVKNLLIFTYLGVKNDPKSGASGVYLLHTAKSSCNKLINQVSCESRGNFPENSWKPTYWAILAVFSVQRAPKIWPEGVIFHTPLEVPTLCPWTKFHGPTLKFFWENGPKPPKTSIMTYFSWLKIHKSKKIKILIPQAFGHL